MNRFSFVCHGSAWAITLGLCANLAQGIDESPIFVLDNTQSSVTIDVIIAGESEGDSDSTSLSGMVNASLAINPSWGTPLITGLNFTGGRYAADKSPLLLDLSYGVFSIHADAFNLAGTLTTPAPPAPIASGGGGDLSYTFDASHHLTTFNEGELEFFLLGTSLGSYNLADPGSAVKYLNFVGANSGFIVTPGGSSQVRSMRFTSANDFWERDPATWELYGTNEAITSADHSLGDGENWALIDLGTFDMATEVPLARNTMGAVVRVTNSTAYRSYRMIFTDLRDTNDPMMQIGGIQIQ